MRWSNYNVVVRRSDATYVFNGASGGLVRVPTRDFARVQQLVDGRRDDIADLSDVIASLIHGQMLLASDRDELELLRSRYHTSRWDTRLFALTLVTSLGCNFDCPYCFEAKHPSLMDRDVQRLVLEVLDDQLPKIEQFAVTWFGGEPLVGKRALFDLADAFIDRCDRAGVAYSSTIVTNGYLLDEGTCRELQKRRVGHVQVGLDGPPEHHDRMRPLAGGRGSFWQVVANLHHAASCFPTSVRVNIDTRNFESVEELFQILSSRGLSSKVSVTPGQIVAEAQNPSAPSASYTAECFSNAQFAAAEREFILLAERYGLAAPSLPQPTGAPCTAVRANELVVGSRGELYKCWNNVGDFDEAVGHISDYRRTNERLAKWLKYDPFANGECRACIALPVCMGGCAAHAFDKLQYENRCGTFRHNYKEQVLDFVAFAETNGVTARTSATALARRMETR